MKNLKKTLTVGFLGTMAIYAIAANPGDIIVNEIMQNPSVISDNDGEYVEIYNTTNAAIDIEGWILRDKDSDSHTIANGAPLEVPPGGFLVLGRNSDSTVNGGVSVDYQFATFQLSNSSDEVILEENGVVIDSVGYDDGSTFPDPNGFSMELLSTALDNTLGANWAAADSLATYGTGDNRGTPGAQNSTAVSCAAGTGNASVTQNLFSDNTATSLDFSFVGVDVLDYGTIEVTIPFEWFWTGNASDVSLTGGIAGSNITIEGDGSDDEPYIITVDGFDQPGDDLGDISISALTTPTILNASGFNFHFATGGDVGSGCETPEPITSVNVWVYGGFTDIDDIQQDIAGGCESVLEGDTLAIQAVVSVEPGVFRSNGLDIYVDDATGGVNVFTFAGNFSNLQRGDEIVLIGSVDTFSGKTELLYLAHEIVSSNNPIAIETITIGDIGEAYEGKLVYIAGVDTVASSALGPWPVTGGGETEITDGTDVATIRIDGDTEIADSSFTPVFPANIAGIIAQFDADSPCDSNYSIQPRDLADLDFTVSVEEISNGVVVKDYSLSQNFPNPFNPTTEINFSLPNETKVTIDIYNVLGQKVLTLLDRKIKQGSHSITFDAKNLSSGAYFYRLTTDDFVQTKKMLLLK
ncbi:MAG: T9SS C-terminal target domain-containing protein [Calditrichaeota bacterium]|nr:MAG: T9SS C-terminal target domain-containing protein [Calditrichota bacterium]